MVELQDQIRELATENQRLRNMIVILKDELRSARAGIAGR